MEVVMAKRRDRGQVVNGWIVVDKPAEMTSIQALGRVRRVFNPRKIGHGGTLDPLATGLLPIAMGEATKTVSHVMDGEKRYRFTLRWGQATATDDAEGEVIEDSEYRPSESEIRAALPRFLGEIEQVPPFFSAIKVGGRRAYDLARAREEFELKARWVKIHRLELISMVDADHANLEVACGKGTYMRALARDLGRALGTCAHVVGIRRTAVGPFTEEHAISLETLEAMGHSAAASGPLLPVRAALDDIPALALTETEARRLRCGQVISMLSRANSKRIREFDNGTILCAMSGDTPVALARYQAGGVHPVRILNL